MLTNLHIQNYALIEKSEINFSTGFSVITGETGAGKSIILGALSMLLGTRAEMHVLQDKSKKCVVEGYFKTKDYQLESFFQQHELDYDEKTCLRRELAPDGKSRAFINDTPVKLSLLKELGDRLVNIHSQRATITLHDTNFQLAVIDNFIGHDQLLQIYKKTYADYINTKEELEHLLQTEAQAKADQDYLQFQFEELDKADLQQGEQEELEAELQTLSHAEEIKAGLYMATNKLDQSDQGLLNQLQEILQLIKKITPFHPGLQTLAGRFHANYIDLKDIFQELTAIENSLTFDPAKAQQVQERLDLIYQLEQKHRVQSVEELLQLKEKLEEKLLSLTFLDTKIESLQQSLSQIFQELKNQADKISKAREAVLPDIEKNILYLLQQLGMPYARFSIANHKLEKPAADGIDSFVFLFNANKGGEMYELSKVASGGELSRLMLSIKSLISGKKLLPTIIFDEIDNGVSGEVAAKVGAILAKMSDTMQVIAITHLPQIAGKGTHHFKVHKKSDSNTTRSTIQKLNREERVEEIAKMISGTRLSEVAIENAKILLS